MMMVMNDDGWVMIFLLFISLEGFASEFKMIFSNIKEGFFEQRSQKGV